MNPLSCPNCNEPRFTKDVKAESVIFECGTYYDDCGILHESYMCTINKLRQQSDENNKKFVEILEGIAHVYESEDCSQESAASIMYHIVQEHLRGFGTAISGEQKEGT